MNNISFSIDARTIFQLGKEAIENKELAVSELVKNAYDADAEFCNIFFEGRSKHNTATQIIFFDNGEGMNADQIEKNWLRIGTTNKVSEPYTKKGRRKIGEKGIGRLALNRLGNVIEIYSKKRNEEGIYLKIDFTRFESGLNLADIPVILKEISSTELKKQGIIESGTKIIINQLLDLWDENAVSELVFETTKLQAPFMEYSLDKNNEIHYFNKSEKENLQKENFHIRVNHFFNIEKTEEEKQLESYLKYSLFRMHAVIDTVENTYSYLYSFHPYEEMERLYNRKQSSFVENRPLIDVSKKGNKLLTDTEDVGKIEVELFAYDFSALVNRMSPFRRITPLKNLVRQSGGVKVYRDRQRVYNYGDPGNDWLELDIRRLNRPGRYLSNNVLIGNVELDRNQSVGLEEKTNREGFIENNFSAKFKKIIQAVVFDFSQLVEEDKFYIKKVYGEQQKRVQVDEVIDNLFLKINSLEDVISKEDSEELTESVVLCKKQIDYIKDILVNVSMNAMDFYSIFHDLEKLVEALEERMRTLETSNEVLNNLEAITYLIKNQNDLLRDKTKKQYNFNNLVEDILYRKRYQFARENVTLETDFEASEGYSGKFNRSSFVRIFENLINNSFYWMEPQTCEKLIEIKTSMNDNFLNLSFSDNGPGFNGDVEFLKEPFVSTKIDNEGIGLGLFIIDELVKNHGGEISCDNQSTIKNGGARVIISLPIEKEEVVGEIIV